MTTLKLATTSKRCYGVDFDDIINLAPLLFIKAAEESLEKQERELDKEEAEYGKLSTLWYQIPGLSEAVGNLELPWIDEDENPEEYFELKRMDIKNKDLFEDRKREEKGLEGFPGLDDNPFANYLLELCETPPMKQTTEMDYVKGFQEYAYYPGHRIPRYYVCLDIFRQITLGSLEAFMALGYGVVSINEIPDDLWEPRKAGERVAFLEDAYLKATQKDETAEA